MMIRNNLVSLKLGTSTCSTSDGSYEDGNNYSVFIKRLNFLTG